jgi:hypothetical protein
MKQIILTILFAITSCLVFGQARLGYSAAEIKTEFSDSRYELTSDYYEDGIYYIAIKTEKATVMHLLNSDKICKASLILPYNDAALNYYVEMYNKEFINISPTKWSVYTNQGTANIELIYPKGGSSCFVWDQVKK